MWHRCRPVWPPTTLPALAATDAGRRHGHDPGLARADVGRSGGTGCGGAGRGVLRRDAPAGGAGAAAAVAAGLRDAVARRSAVVRRARCEDGRRQSAVRAAQLAGAGGDRPRGAG
ncbi:hypothetical protein G6F62_014068 [Rhizopus arrhizus]|nr:hypothetical protein G6F62_014068 [Rhizopus arrhizus]